MKATATLWTAASFLLGQSFYGAAVHVVPVQKAVELLGSMLTKAEQDKHEEQVQYAVYEKFCEYTTTDKQKAIVEADEKIDFLNAEIYKLDTKVETLGQELQGHNDDMAGWQSDAKAAKAVRKVQANDFLELERNYTESVHALGQAIMVLKQQNYDRPGIASLLEKVGVLDRLPKGTGGAIEAFLARTGEEPEVPVTAYEFRSDDILTMLEKLKDKFQDELSELREREVGRAHSHQLLEQDLTDSMAAAEAEVSRKTANQAKSRQAATEARADLQDLSASRAADSAYLSDLVDTCAKKKADYESRQKLRTEEINALEKALEILSSDSVAGAAEKHLPTMLLHRSNASGASALSQLRAATRSPDQVRAAAFLREVSSRIGSRTLSALAVRAQEDPFAKVKKLIEELLDRLMSQATEEATHKGWCDTELATNEHTRKTKTAQAETLTAQIEGLEASLAELTKDLSDLSAAVAKLDEAMANATKLRQSEKAENIETIKDAQEAQEALKQAMGLLRKFYAQASSATALVLSSAGQSPQQAEPSGPRGPEAPEAPQIFGDEAYKGQQSEHGGVMAMLEVIVSDFARLESDTATSEAASQKEYEVLMEASKVDKAQKEMDIKHKTSAKMNQEETLGESRLSLETTERELSNAQASYEKLKPPCMHPGMSYEERVNRRREEVEALKEALRILSGEDMAALMQDK